MVSIDRSVLKGEAPRFSADFTQTLLCERPFTFLRRLVRLLGIDNIISMSDRNVHSTIFNLTQTWKTTDKDLDKDTDTDKDKDTDLEFDLELEFEVEYFSKIYIRRCSPHSVIWITCNTSQRKFQWR